MTVGEKSDSIRVTDKSIKRLLTGHFVNSWICFVVQCILLRWIFAFYYSWKIGLHLGYWMTRWIVLLNPSPSGSTALSTPWSVGDLAHLTYTLNLTSNQLNSENWKFACINCALITVYQNGYQYINDKKSKGSHLQVKTKNVIIFYSPPDMGCPWAAHCLKNLCKCHKMPDLRYASIFWQN